MPSYSFQLPLAVAPEVRDPEIFGEMLRVYNSIKLLAAKLDEYTGMTPAELGDKTLEESLSIGRYMKYEMLCSSNIASGRLCTLVDLETNPSATVRKARMRQPASAGLGAIPLVCAIALGTYVNGELGSFMMKGLITFETASLKPGKIYEHYSVGLMQERTDPLSTLQPIGFALDETHLWFEPKLY